MVVFGDKFVKKLWQAPENGTIRYILDVDIPSLHLRLVESSELPGILTNRIILSNFQAATTTKQRDSHDLPAKAGKMEEII